MKIKIPLENYDSLEKKITYLNNKATKLGLSEITLDIIYSIGVAIPQRDGLYREVEYVNVNVNGEPPTLDGCKLVGIIEPNINGKNVIKEISDEIKIPEKYRHTDLCDCEHCGIKRERTSAFIVLIEDTNEFLQVGRVCLKSYTGDKDPKNIALYEAFFKLKDYAHPDNSIKSRQTFNVNEVLSYLIVVNELYPEMDKIYAKKIILNNYRNGGYDKDFSEIRKNVALNITDETLNNVEKLKDSIFKLNNADNNNIWNYQEIMKEKYTTQPEILLEVIEFKKAYDMRMTLIQKMLKDDLIKKQKEFEELELKKTRVHVGVIGEKLITQVTLEKVISVNSDFGTILVHTFRDNDNNNLVWFNSGMSMFESKEEETKAIKDKKKFFISGTVKDYSVFRDEKSTKLIRVKNLGEELPLLKVKKPKKTI